jgi:nucleoside 2-deoxyribosyltransferase
VNTSDKSKHIYICSAYRNTKLNSQITDALESAGLIVYSPGRDTDQSNFYKQNIAAICAASCVIAVLDYTGRDFCFEIGYTASVGIPIISVSTNGAVVESLSMMTELLSVYKCQTVEGLVNIACNLLGSKPDVQPIVASKS